MQENAVEKFERDWFGRNIITIITEVGAKELQLIAENKLLRHDAERQHFGRIV